MICKVVVPTIEMHGSLCTKDVENSTLYHSPSGSPPRGASSKDVGSSAKPLGAIEMPFEAEDAGDEALFHLPMPGMASIMKGFSNYSRTDLKMLAISEKRKTPTVEPLNRGQPIGRGLGEDKHKLVLAEPAVEFSSEQKLELVNSESLLKIGVSQSPALFI